MNRRKTGALAGLRGMWLALALAALASAGASAQAEEAAPTPCPGLYRMQGETFAPTVDRYQSLIGQGLYRSLTVNFLPHPLLQEKHMGWALVAVNGEGSSQYVKVLFLGYDKAPAEAEQAQSEERVQAPDAWLGQVFVRDEKAQWRAERWGSALPRDSRLDGPWYFSGGEERGVFTVMTVPHSGELPEPREYVPNPFFGKEVRTKTVNLRVESFGSFCTPAQAFTDILALRHADVPAHAQADSASGVSFTVPKGEYLGVLKTEGDWLQVARPLWRIGGDQARVIRFLQGPNARAWGGMKLDVGWVHRNDLYAGFWVPQRAQTPRYRFEAAVNTTGDEDSMPDERGSVLAVKVTDRRTGVSSIIDDLGYPQASASDEVVHVQDVNFDGHPDFSVFAHDGGAGPNSGDAYYLYNPANGRFEYNDELSDLTQVEIDTKAKRIISAYRNGAGEHGGGTYTFENGKLVQLTSWVDRASVGGYFGRYERGERVNGQWRYTSFATSWFDAKTPLEIHDRPALDATSRRVTLDQVILREDEADNPLWFELVQGDAFATMGWVPKITTMGWVPKTALLPRTTKPLEAGSAAMQVSALVGDGDLIAAIGLRESGAQDFFQIIVLPQYLPWRADAARLTQEQGALVLGLHWPGDEYPPERWRYDAPARRFVHLTAPEPATDP